MSDSLELAGPERPEAALAVPAPLMPADPLAEMAEAAPNLPVLSTGLVPGTAPAPVAAQRSSHVNASKLESEKVVLAAPLSFTGSAARIWKLTGSSAQPAARVALGIVAVLLISSAWTFVAAWYMTFGLLVVPYRLLRRGQRKRKREALMHREQMAAIQSLQQNR